MEEVHCLKSGEKAHEAFENVCDIWDKKSDLDFKEKNVLKENVHDEMYIIDSDDE